MSLFENLCENYLEEMAAPRGAITIPALDAVSRAPKPDWINKFTETDVDPRSGERRKPNARDGKYNGQDAWKALELFLKSGHGSGKTYPDNAKMQAAIFDFLKHTAGWSASPAEKWMKTIGNYLYGLNLITQTPDESGNNPAGAALPQASSEDIKDEEGSGSEEAENTPAETEVSPEETPGETEEVPVEPEPEETPSQKNEEPAATPDKAGFTGKEGAELDLSDIQQALLDLIEAEGPLENNELVSKIDRNLIPRQYADSDATIKSYLRGIAGELGRKDLIKRTDDGWTAIPKQDNGGTLADMGSEEDQAADLDRAKQAELANLHRQSLGGMTPKMGLEDSVDFKHLYSNIFKSMSVIKG